MHRSHSTCCCPTGYCQTTTVAVARRRESPARLLGPLRCNQLRQHRLYISQLLLHARHRRRHAPQLHLDAPNALLDARDPLIDVLTFLEIALDLTDALMELLLAREQNLWR